VQAFLELVEVSRSRAQSNAVFYGLLAAFYFIFFCFDFFANLHKIFELHTNKQKFNIKDT